MVNNFYQSSIYMRYISYLSFFCFFTSKCLNKTLARVSLNAEGHNIDSQITTRLSFAFTSKCLVVVKKKKVIK